MGRAGTKLSPQRVQTTKLPMKPTAMQFHGTTILTIRRDGKVAMGGDGQVTLGTAIMKADAVKIRRLMDDKVMCGFAGASADAFALLERFEAKLKDYPDNVPRRPPNWPRNGGPIAPCGGWRRMMAVVDAETRCWSPAPAT